MSVNYIDPMILIRYFLSENRIVYFVGSMVALLLTISSCVSETENDQKQPLEQRLNEKHNHFQQLAEQVNSTSFSLDATVKDLHNQSRPLNEIIQDTTLILRYNQFNCSLCRDMAKDALEKFRTVTPFQKEPKIIALVSSYESKNHWLNMEQTTIPEIEIYKIDTGYLPMLIEEQNVPYFFIIDSQMLMQDVHLPTKEMPYPTELYLKQIGKKYWQ
jgi:hypothetical protein